MKPADVANTYSDEGEPSDKGVNNIMLEKNKRFVADSSAKLVRVI